MQYAGAAIGLHLTSDDEWRSLTEEHAGETSQIVNRPVVPRGSRARERLGGAPTEPEDGWYRGQRIQWFRFDETQLIAGPAEPVPTSPISVTFNKNPDQPGGGPPSGFRTEPGGRQTHNVASSRPGDVD